MPLLGCALDRPRRLSFLVCPVTTQGAYATSPSIWCLANVVRRCRDSKCDFQTMLLEQRRPNLDAFDGIGRPRWRRDLLFEDRPRHGLALCRFSPNSGDSLGLVDIVGGHGKVSILEPILKTQTNLRCHRKSRPFSIASLPVRKRNKSNPTPAKALLGAVRMPPARSWGFGFR